LRTRWIPRCAWSITSAKLVDWDATAGRFAYDLAYADKQSDWTSPS